FVARQPLLKLLPGQEEIVLAVRLVLALLPRGGGNREPQRQVRGAQQPLDHGGLAAPARPRQDDERPHGTLRCWHFDFRLPIIVFGHGRLSAPGRQSTIENHSMFCTSSRTFSRAPLISTT